MKFKESDLAHKFLDGLKGIEIGGSIHNPFGLDTKNVDYTDNVTTFKQYEMDLDGATLPIDIIAPGDQLPFPDESQDFVISSHVLEHFPDPIKALKEWYRVIKPGGYIFMIVPHKERTFDEGKKRTTLRELIDRYAGKKELETGDGHHSFWVTEDILELIDYLNWKIVFFQDVDDKVGNGFAVVVQKGENKSEDSELLAHLRWLLGGNLGVIVKSKDDLGILEKRLREAKRQGQKNEALAREIAQMASSKFWKLRAAYLKIKNIFSK